MVDTIESFVAKLQAEGVEAGKQAAEKLKADARQQADRVLADAKAQTDKIIADAKVRAENIISRGRTELRLASRDAALALRAALSRALSAIVAEGAKTKLEDADFIGPVLHELVVLYAQADAERRTDVRINVRPELREKLVSWALHELSEEALRAPRPSIDLKGTLSQAGFEYEVDGATIEVTLDSVVETLSGMITPALRELLGKAMTEENRQA